MRANGKRTPHLRTRRLYGRTHGQGLVLRPHVALRRYARDEGSLFKRAQRRAHDRARTPQRDRQARYANTDSPDDRGVPILKAYLQWYAFFASGHRGAFD